MNKKLGKRLVTFALSLVVASTVFVGASFSAAAYTQTTGVVSSDNVKVRSSASTTASQVSSLKKGDKIDIVDESTDASGYVWYKIFVNKSEYGYVRSDLVTKSGDSAPKTSTSTNSSTQTENKAAPDLPATTVTATEQKTATVTSESVNVRGGAGTGYDSVGKVTKGENVTITGEASDKDGKTWYQVTFGSNGKTGFVRSDLVAISEAAPAEGGDGAAPAEGGEGENPEATEGGEGGEGENGSESEQPQATASDVGDGTYSLVYTADEEGTNTWYLYDNVEGYRVKVKKLIEAAQSTEALGKLSAANKKYKTVVVILALVAAALAVAVVLLVLKLRDAMYYEDEEEEEEYDRYAPKKRPAREEEPEEERPVRRRERTVRPEEDDEESYASARGAERRGGREVRDANPARRPAPEATSYRRSDERTVRPERNAEDDRPSRRAPEPERPVRNAAPKRKTRNFIGDDDDFEFEFLDLDDEK
ncbi:SH3 domain-containing protein [Butyrivibrio sp. AE3009]|uniref:SH3 domain-containing protein n=1 Tax=Butyrivibrio sp. AE3009 TaxID=1280666 RepID=UPI0003B48ADA|nr:SH3 domain-containing protein [Butyrivibrio sp. AE3009]